VTLAYLEPEYQISRDSLYSLDLVIYLSTQPQPFGDSVQLTDDLQLSDGKGFPMTLLEQLTDNTYLTDNLQLVD
jgi:hypothetical protein